MRTENQQTHWTATQKLTDNKERSITAKLNNRNVKKIASPITFLKTHTKPPRHTKKINKDWNIANEKGRSIIKTACNYRKELENISRQKKLLQASLANKKSTLNKPNQNHYPSGGSGPSKRPDDNFLSGFKGTPKSFQQLQTQLRASYSPDEIKQTMADQKTSSLSAHERLRYQAALKRAVKNLASNPDTAHQIKRSFIEQSLKGDKEAIRLTVASLNKAQNAFLTDKLTLAKMGKPYKQPSIKPTPNCSLQTLCKQLNEIKSVNDFKAVIANRAATNISGDGQQKYQGLLKAALTGAAKSPAFASELTRGFLEYALQHDRQGLQEVLKLREKTMVAVLERRLERLKRN